LEWNRVDVARKTAWLDRTKNGTPRGVPLNSDAIAVLEAERGKHPQYCFTYRGDPRPVAAWKMVPLAAAESNPTSMTTQWKCRWTLQVEPKG